MVVRGRRITLRYPAPEDAPSLFELGRDVETTRFLSWGPYRDQSEARRYIASVPGRRESGEELVFAIDEGGRAIGMTGLTELSRRDRRAVIGTWIGRPHWGSGVNTESKALLLALAFRALGLSRVSAYAHPENVRSLAALRRIGFEQEGVLKAWHMHRGTPRDVAILRLMREDFEAGPLAETRVELVGEPPACWVTAPSGST
jgi:[ribosomal protein S5]-alanine N-acetyltransferase